MAKKPCVDRSRYHNLIVHDPVFYNRCKDLYNCAFASSLDIASLAPNKNSADGVRDSFPLVPSIPSRKSACYDLKHISFCSDWGSRPVPVQSFDRIQTFLDYVHNFTALGLEAMGTAFSYGDDGDLQYLVMPPQVGNAFNRENGTTEFVALQSFCSSDPGKNPDNFIMRCWIHTHPMLHAFMSSQDIVQLYYLRREDDNSFGIVLSPRREGVKALCVHLTDKSTKE